MAKQNVLFSFDYENDISRAEKIRKMDVFDDTTIMPGKDWEAVENKTDEEIKSWIDNEVEKCSCLLVLVGEKTFENKWINYEIKKAHDENKGILGVFIHKIENADGKQCEKGKNPFKDIHIGSKFLSNYAICYDSDYQTSRYVYSDIESHLNDFITDAIANRKKY